MGRKKVVGGKGQGIRLSVEAKKAITEWTDKHEEELGRTASRLVPWFVDADPIVQAVIISKAVRRVPKIHATALREIAEKIEKTPPDIRAVAITKRAGVEKVDV